MKKILIENALIINEGEEFTGYVVVAGDTIEIVGEGSYDGPRPDHVIDATDRILMPGIIDDQVHFREPGLTYKGDIHSESIAAVAGGVTSYMEMPNTKPPATTIDLLDQKFDLAAASSVANYSFYIGATNDNIGDIRRVDPRRVCGVKMFLGSSTGNMLIDEPDSIAAVMAESPVLVAAHCEEESIIKKNLEYYEHLYGDRITPNMHPMIRTAEACYVSSARAVETAVKYNANLHILHVSTEKELTLFEAGPLNDKLITSEACVHHLWFNDHDYRRRGNFIKWNPAIKTETDREALVLGVLRGKIDIVATDHAPHTLEEKKLPYLQAPSGGPLVQHSLNVMLEMSKRGDFSLSTVVHKMCHAPADRFRIKRRGFIRPGFFADLVIVNPDMGWEVSRENILYKCGWSPFEGDRFTTAVTHTIINGKVVFENGKIDREFRGAELEFYPR